MESLGARHACVAGTLGALSRIAKLVQNGRKHAVSAADKNRPPWREYRQGINLFTVLWFSAVILKYVKCVSCCILRRFFSVLFMHTKVFLFCVIYNWCKFGKCIASSWFECFHWCLFLHDYIESVIEKTVCVVIIIFLKYYSSLSSLELNFGISISIVIILWFFYCVFYTIKIGRMQNLNSSWSISFRDINFN